MSAHLEDSSSGTGALAPPATVGGSHLRAEETKAACWQQFIDQLASMGTRFEDLDPDGDFKAILRDMKLTAIQQAIVLKMIHNHLHTTTAGQSGSGQLDKGTSG